MSTQIERLAALLENDTLNLAQAKAVRAAIDEHHVLDKTCKLLLAIREITSTVADLDDKETIQAALKLIGKIANTRVWVDQ